MAERKWGLFKSGDENSFESAEEVRRRKALENQLPVRHDRPKGIPSLDRRLEALEQRAEQQRELSPRSENQVRVRLKDTSTINVLSDLHLGHPDTNVRRIRQELEVIRNTPNSYVLFDGDLVDGIFWVS